MSIDEYYESSNRELDNFLIAKSEAKKEELEQTWDFVRHQMWASVQPHIEKKLKVSDLIRLDRDAPKTKLTEYTKQELKTLAAKLDKGMNLVSIEEYIKSVNA